MQNLHESSSPVQLERLLQVPLQVIMLEDLLREKSSSVSPPSNTSNSGGSRLCRSADSQLPSSKGEEGLGTAKSLSSSCLFDCCSKNISRTNKSGSLAKFKTASLKLPDGSVAVVPVMDAGEDTDTDTEMQKYPLEESKQIETPVEVTKEDRRRHSGSSEEKRPETCILTQDKTYPGSSSSSASVSPRAHEPGSAVILGKVLENPTRYEDFLIAHECRIRNGVAAAATSVIRDGDREASLRELEKHLTDLDTLKLTFYNDGRKESVKEFQTSLQSKTSPKLAREPDYYENQHGLQLSRILREDRPSISASSNDTQRQRSSSFGSGSYEQNNSGNDNMTKEQHHFKITRTENTLNNSSSKNNGNCASPPFTQPQVSLPNSLIRNLNNNYENSRITNNTDEKSWHQWENLQVSRCQKDINKIITSDGETNNNYINNNHHLEKPVDRTTLIQDVSGEKGESENSIERHLQSYLTSLKYVKPAGEGGPASLDGEGGERGIIPVVSSNQGAQHQQQPPVVSHHKQVIQPGIMRVTPPERSPCTDLGTERIVSVGTRRLSIFPSHQISPPQQQQQPESLDTWSERTIARIPTRPYLRRNITYEQPHQLSQQKHQQQSISMMGTAVAATTPLHSPPKRFKSNNFPTNPLIHHSQQAHNPSKQQHQQHQQQHQQQPIFIPGRYPNNASNSIRASVPSSGNGNVDPPLHQHHHRPPQQQHQQQALSISSSSQAMSYGNHQQQPYHAQQLHSQQPHRVSSYHGGNPLVANTQSPHHSSLSTNAVSHQPHPQKHHATQNPSHHQHHHQQHHDSMMSPPSASGNTNNPDQNTYYDRLRHYWEYYQRHELDWTKLAEYYQKYNFYPWEILSARDESMAQQWKQQHHGHPQRVPVPGATSGHNVHGGGARGTELGNMSQQQQHQLAFRAMNAAAAAATTSPVGGTTPSGHKSVVPYTPANHQNMSMQQPHGRIAKVVDLSLPQGSIVQNRYHHNSPQQPLHHQIQHQSRPYQHQQVHHNTQQYHHQPQQQPHQQVQIQQQDVHHQHQVRYNQQQQRQQQQHFDQWPQYHQTQQMKKPHHQGVPVATNYDIQNSPHYRNAYNQLAAAAAAVATATGSAVSQNQQRPSGSIGGGSISGKLHNPVPTVVPPPSMMTVGDPTRALSPEEISYPVNIHRHTLELAIKNNFRGASTYNNSNPVNHGGNYVSPNGERSFSGAGRRQPSPSPPPLTRSPPPSHNFHQQHSSLTWSKVVNRGDGGSDGGNNVGVVSITKEPMRSTVPMSSSPQTHQTSVIRRLQHLPTSPSATSSSINPIIRKTPIISWSPNMINIRSNAGSSDVGQEMNLKRSYSNNCPTAFHYSPGKPPTSGSVVPLVAGEEEIVTTNVAPTSVIATVNPVEEVNLVDDNGNGHSGEGDSGRPAWKYDHVVLLDSK